MFDIKHTLRAIDGLLDHYGRMWLWVVVSLLLLAAVAPFNPFFLGSYAWAMAKISGAAALAYGFDLTAFRDADPARLEGIEKSMAQTRRATIIAAAMIAAGLIG
jgi:hypothetical protein